MAKCDTFFAEHWRDFLAFDEVDGSFTYRKDPVGCFASERKRDLWIKRYAGVRAEKINKRGYAEITIKRHRVRAHRLVWFVLHGDWPVVIDHIDRNRSNNRPDNLRACSVQQNNFNRKSVGGKSRYKGVILYRGKWCANIRENRKKRWIGTFTDEVDAARAYDEAAARIHGEYAVLNFPQPESSDRVEHGRAAGVLRNPPSSGGALHHSTHGGLDAAKGSQNHVR